METLYLLGAGASAGKKGKFPDTNIEFIPTISNFQKRLSDEINRFSDLIEDIESNWKNISYELHDDLVLLYNGILSMGTPDIYAKSLYLQGNIKDYISIKRALSFFLVLLQLSKHSIDSIDPRYLGFFAAIIEKDSTSKPSLHKDIKIATWNYDLQVPLSLSTLLSMDLDRIHHHIGEVYHSTNSNITNPGKFFRLNGYAGAFLSRDRISGEYLADIFSEELNAEKRILKLIEIFNELKEHDTPYLNFAWDNHPSIESERGKFFQSLKNVRVIVVIGYSFPSFNRFIDRDLFQSCESLEKVYVQDKNPDIVKRVAGIFGNEKGKNKFIPEIEHISDIGQFFIPPELDQ